MAKPKRRPRKRKGRKVEQRVTREPRQPSLIVETDCWHNDVLGEVLELLKVRADGHACITTPDGAACYVTVRFTTGGSA